MTVHSLGSRARAIWAALAVVILAVPAAAQPTTPDALAAFEKELDALFAVGNGLTAEQAAARAVKTSPTVSARVAEIEIAIAIATTTALVRVPRVGVTATYTRLSPLDPVSFGPGAPALEFLENSYGVQAQVQLALSDYVVRYPQLIEAARLGTQSARLGKRSSEVNTAYDGRIAYYEWIRAKLQLVVAKRQLAQIRATLGQVRALADAQRVSRADLMRVESQEAQIEQTADQLQQLSELREEQLRVLIGAAQGEVLAIGEDIRVDLAIPSTPAYGELVATATRQRLDFQAFDVGIRAREKQRSGERAGYYPQLSAFLIADHARPNQRVFPQVDEFRFTWQAGLQLTWTLNEPLLTRALDERLSAEIRKLRADRESLERGTRIAVLAAQQAVAIAERALVTSKKGLEAANEQYRVRQALLAAQRATAVELIDAETELTRARITALNARIDLRVAMVELAHAVGEDTK